MSQRNPRFHGVDERLASLDERLAAIQHDLAPEGAPRTEASLGSPAPAAPAAAPTVPLSAPTDRATGEVELLHGLYTSLLASNRQLLEGYEAALGRLSRRRPEPPHAAAEATLSAGPFGSTTSLREFERVLGELPDVREVALRGYEHGNRAILDVQLD